MIWNWFSKPLSIFASAPCMVAVGMSSLILGGFGASHLMGNSHVTVNFGKHLINTSQTNAPTSASNIAQQVSALKGETANLVTEGESKINNFNLLSYAAKTNLSALKVRRDPFAPITPPLVRLTYTHISAKLAQPLASVQVPGDTNSGISFRRVHKLSSNRYHRYRVSVTKIPMTN